MYEKGAILSRNRLYRHVLWREWDSNNVFKWQLRNVHIPKDQPAHPLYQSKNSSTD